MVYTSLTTVAAAALLLAQATTAESLYHKQSPVLQVNAKNYDRLIAKSNHTSIVEFYAPWCGHCKNLHPQWEKAARGLAGLAKVAAVNCDEDENKQFCGTMGVKGFPTLKIVKPGKKIGRPFVEDYQGPREAKDIIEAVVAKIPNHVTKITDKTVETFDDTNKNKPKAILFTEKGATSALWKAVAVDFLGSITVAQVRNTEKSTVKKYGVTKFPTVLLILAEEDATPITYDGSLKKPGLVEFLSKVANPNPDPAPAKVNMPKTKSSSKKKPAAAKKSDKKAKEDFESASSSHAKSEATEAIPTAASETIIEPAGATESPSPMTPEEEATWAKAQKDAKHVAKLTPLTTDERLFEECFRERFGTCLLVLTPPQEALTTSSNTALENLAEVSHRYWTIGHKMFPFWHVPDHSDLEKHSIRQLLGLEQDVEVIAINKKRRWYGRYEGSDYSFEAMDNFINQIRMGEFQKTLIPQTFLNEKKYGAEQVPLGDIPLEKKTTAEKIAEPETQTSVDASTTTQTIASVAPEVTPEEGAEPTEVSGDAVEEEVVEKPAVKTHIADEL